MRFRAYRLLPQGSYPQVVDVRANQAHDLYGPVNKFLCQSYDKAQVGFLVSGMGAGRAVGGGEVPHGGGSAAQLMAGRLRFTCSKKGKRCSSQ